MVDPSVSALSGATATCSSFLGALPLPLPLPSSGLSVEQHSFWPVAALLARSNISAEAMAALSPEEQKRHEDLTMTGNIAIVREILESPDKTHLASTGRNGRWSLEMIHGIYASHLAGQRMDLPLGERGNPLA